MQKLADNYKKYMCPVGGCEHGARSMPGLSAHLRKEHGDLWRGSIKATLKKLKVDAVTIVPGTEPERRKKTRRHRRTTGRPGRYLGRKKPALQRAAKSEVLYCPRCSLHLEPIALAMAFDPNEA